jgi:TolB-like protein
MSATLVSNGDAPHLKRKRSKVRSAWISFVGRIVAQIIGAVASVTLGLVVLHKYGFPDRASNGSHAASITAPAVSAAHDSDRKARRAAGEVALAVLPIQNYSQDAAHAYFADGVTEALTAEVAQIPGLRVTSRTSSMGYKGTTKSLPAIARELDVDLILEGSVVRELGLVRATVQLIEADTDQHVWARSYDRPVRNLLLVQGEMARTIAKDVSAALASRRVLPLP